MVNDNEEMDDFVNYILSPENDEKEKELGLSHPSVEFEEKERELADKIELEKEVEARSTYYTCKRFHGDQDALEILYNTGKFKDIKVIEGRYYTNKLKECSLIKDENGEWHYVNKLNTNWSDLSELLTTLFIKGGMIEEMTTKNVTEVKNYLEGLRQNNLKDIKKSNLYRLFKKYFNQEEYKDFTHNTKKNTAIGDRVEDLAKELLENKGFKLIYNGRNGNFIDMKYGIDLIMELEGEVFLIQVKSKAAAAKKAMDYPTYKHIDMFVGESPDKNGVILYDRDQLQEGTFIEKELLKENLDYLINKFYDSGEVNLD